VPQRHAVDTTVRYTLVTRPSLHALLGRESLGHLQMMLDCR
jgi:hypothetical protein